MVAEQPGRSHHATGGLRHTSLHGTHPSVAALGMVSFQGVIADLKLQGDPRAAERQCEEEDDDTEEVSAGSPAGAGWEGGCCLMLLAQPLPFSLGKCRSLVISAVGQKVATNPQGKSG